MFWEEQNVNSFRESLEMTKGVCVFPIGCIEKHGNHLPLGTDVYTSREIAARAAKIEEVMIFPSWPLGIVAEVKHKAGTVAVSSQLQFTVMEAIFEEISRNGYKKIVICSGHGGNTNFLNYFTQACLEKKRDYVVYNAACLRLTQEQYDYLTEKYGTIPPGGHADFNETSSIMAIRPDLVHMEQMDPKDSIGTGRASWYESHGVSTGINWYAEHPAHFAGDPTGASAKYGQELLDIQAANLAEVLHRIKNDDMIPELFAEFYAQHDRPGI